MMRTPNPDQQSLDLQPVAPEPETAPAAPVPSETEDTEAQDIKTQSTQTDPTQAQAEKTEPVTEQVESSKTQQNQSENKQIVTPYAFTVSPELLGLPLASPMRRSLAIFIDVFLMAVLSTISALFLAAFVALTFFRAGAQQNANKAPIKRLFRGIGASLLFVIFFSLMLDLNEQPEEPSSTVTVQTNAGMQSLLDLAAELVELGCEQDVLCYLEASESLAVSAASMQVPSSDIIAATQDIVEQKDWDAQSQKMFMQRFIDTLNEEKNAYEQDVLAIADERDLSQDAQDPKITSIIAWGRALMQDLGLGLGWAAVYFTVLTAWWNGQTLGKKVCGIKVVKLDGSHPSLWESFVRYGGYGAGLTTGLLGFLQIYWDPNRQAIQDKISETLVLDARSRIERI